MNEGGIGIEHGLSLEKSIGDEDRMYSFLDIYPRDEIKNDIDRVVWIEKGFEVDDKMNNKNRFGEKKGDDLEFLIDQYAETSNWFGENSFLSKTLKYDDYINHVDSVLEFDVGKSTPKRVALNIDCTASSVTLEHKINMNMDSLVLGKRKIKYFESQVDGFKGELTCIPVVIGIDSDHVREMMENLKDKKYMEKNPAQIVFLKEISMQLNIYKDFLSSKIFNYREIVREIDSIGKIIDLVLEDKKVLKDDRKTKEYMLKDKTFKVMDYIIGKKKSPN